LQQKLAARLMKLAEALEYRAKSPGKVDDPVNQELIRLLRTGDSEMQNSLKLIRLFHLLPSAQSNALQAAIMRSQAMLIHLCAALLFDNTQYGDEPPTSGGTPCSQSMQVLAGHLRQLARLLHNGKLIDAIRLKAPFSNDTMQDPLFHIAASLFKPDRPHNKAGNQVKAPKLEPSGGFFKPDAFTNPNYSRFALKTTAAAILAYIIYTSIQWDGIHTAMITCYVAALGTTGETVHKLVLRITGCLIGAALGMASLAFLMPHMTSITQLVALVFLGILLSAWVSSGSERISYAGIQVGLAFLMTVLQGFGPDVQMSVATDRIYGILLGNALLFIAFTQIWPVTVVSSAQDKLGKCRQWLERWEQLGPQPFEVRYRLFNQILDTLEQSREELVYNRFEPKKIQASDRELRDLRTTIDAFERQAITLVLGEAIISPAALSPGHGGLANAQIDHAGLDAESCMRPGTIPGQ